jgi:hypothetical protein
MMQFILIPSSLSHAAAQQLDALMGAFPLIDVRPAEGTEPEAFMFEVGVVTYSYAVENPERVSFRPVLSDGLVLAIGPTAHSPYPAVGDHVAFAAGLAAKVLAREMSSNLVRYLATAPRATLAEIRRVMDRRILVSDRRIVPA